jgi:hypothetical protein
MIQTSSNAAVAATNKILNGLESDISWIIIVFVCLFWSIPLKWSKLFILVSVLLVTACAAPARNALPAATPVQKTEKIPEPTITSLPPTATAAPTATLAPSSTPMATPTPVDYPLGGYGPSGFPANIDPLTGLKPADARLLERRPIVIKVENLPREHRPQSGLSLADVVYEYYTEEGSTRFAAVYYGQEAARVGPIRSGRFFDVNLVQMYKAVFIFGSAYIDIWNRFIKSDFVDRLLLETDTSCPAICRYLPKAENILVANTAALDAYLKTRGVNNSRQNLDGMRFDTLTPVDGKPAAQVFVRFSGAIYNRWDYDPASKRYQRYAETQNDINRVNEVYALLTDKLTGKPIAVDNLVMVCVPHKVVTKTTESEIIDILPSPAGGSVVSCDGKQYEAGSGPAFAAREGQLYPLTWKRQKTTDLIGLFDADGKPYAYKPGQTWFEVIGASSSVKTQGNIWKFDFKMAP